MYFTLNLLVEPQISLLLAQRLLAVREVPCLRKVLPHKPRDIRKGLELRLGFRSQDHLTTTSFDFHFRTLEAKFLGEPQRLTATMLKKLRRRHSYSM
jgi:hypothetical protein